MKAIFRKHPRKHPRLANRTASARHRPLPNTRRPSPRKTRMKERVFHNKTPTQNVLQKITKQRIVWALIHLSKTPKCWPERSTNPAQDARTMLPA